MRCQRVFMRADQLTQALRDTARLDTMERLGWDIRDAGDQVSLQGLAGLRDAIDEYCNRNGIDIK